MAARSGQVLQDAYRTNGFKYQTMHSFDANSGTSQLFRIYIHILNMQSYIGDAYLILLWIRGFGMRCHYS